MEYAEQRALLLIRLSRRKLSSTTYSWFSLVYQILRFVSLGYPWHERIEKMVHVILQLVSTRDIRRDSEMSAPPLPPLLIAYPSTLVLAETESGAGELRADVGLLTFRNCSLTWESCFS